MSRAEGGHAADAVRVLASPVFVLALVVLILNDHVLKQAWPGPVTGKLSDVAGLVVAPLLLAVPLAVIGVRRSVPVAVGFTGVGFVLAKTSLAGAAATSAVWSLTGIPTMIRADVTDLVALPALGLAWWVDRKVRSSRALPWRRAVATATGMALLPVAVLATAATSCDEGVWITGASRVDADFPGRPRAAESRLVMSESFSSSAFTIDATRTIGRDVVELSSSNQALREQCDPSDAARCWRVAAGGVEVAHSVDGGQTWESELSLSEDELAAISDESNDCGGSARIESFDLAVLPTGGEPVVVVPLGKGGAYIRDEDAQWELFSIARLRDSALPSVSGGRVTQVIPLDQPPPTTDPTGHADPTGRPTPTCAQPTPTTVTPDPSNGPPTTYDVCP